MLNEFDKRAPRDARAWITELASDDAESRKTALRELGELGSSAFELVADQFDKATPPLRSRLCAAVGRIARRSTEARVVEFLLRALRDSDAQTRRAAASALGKLRESAVEAALIDALGRETDEPTQRSLIRSLGSAGGPAGFAALRSVAAQNPETERVLSEARTKLERDALRLNESELDPRACAPVPLDIVFHCRAGLEDFVLRELGRAFAAAYVSGTSRVSARLEGPLARMFESRIATHVSFALPSNARRDAPLETQVEHALTSERALCVFKSFTRGTIRYRLEWVGKGHRRAATFRVANAVRARCPELVNDPSSSPWQARIHETEQGVRVELWPRGLDDPRFAYRVSDVPAASHPTIAAALARAAGVRAGDIVWDPFVGSGLELVERALLGPYHLLLGSDVDARALSAAERNLKSAGISRYHLQRTDARDFEPPRPVDLIVTNPPFGRRARLDTPARDLMHAALGRSAHKLASGGRIVWIVPDVRPNIEVPEGSGLRPALRCRVDLGGFHGELQVLVRD